MSANISPQLRQRFLDANGAPLAGGKLFSYIAGSDTPLATYTDESATEANANPIILDAEGYCDMWLKDQYYKFVLTDSNDVEQWTVDRILGQSNAGGAGESVKVASSSPWFSPEGDGAVAAEEYGVEVFKMSKDANQKIKKIVNVPSDYATAGPINMNVFLYSPDIVNNVRFKLTVILISKKIGVQMSAALPTATEQRYVKFSVPQETYADVLANSLRSKQFVLSPDGSIGGESVYPQDQIIVELQRIATNTGIEGVDSDEDVRILKHNTEEVFS